MRNPTVQLARRKILTTDKPEDAFNVYRESPGVILPGLEDQA